MPEQKPYKKHSSSDHQKGCTVPSAGECCSAGANSHLIVPGDVQNPSKPFQLLQGRKYQNKCNLTLCRVYPAPKPALFDEGKTCGQGCVADSWGHEGLGKLVIR